MDTQDEVLRMARSYYRSKGTLFMIPWHSRPSPWKLGDPGILHRYIVKLKDLGGRMEKWKRKLGMEEMA